MAAPLAFAPAAVLLDIEGTITPNSYVVTVMYPWLAEHLPSYIEAHRDDAEVKEILADTLALDGSGADPAGVLLGWLAEDRKAPPLKRLQGLVWDAGYKSGAFAGQIYDDALDALRRWQEAGLPAYIFSSASVLTQTEFFRHSRVGDIRPLFAGHFDTDVGAKVETRSYHAIAAAIGIAPEALLFFSDNPRELVAASGAGVAVVHVLREDTPSDPRFPEIRAFDEVTVTRRPDAA